MNLINSAPGNIARLHINRLHRTLKAYVKNSIISLFSQTNLVSPLCVDSVSETKTLSKIDEGMVSMAMLISSLNGNQKLKAISGGKYETLSTLYLPMTTAQD